jgi:hypothetical protein
MACNYSLTITDHLSVNPVSASEWMLVASDPAQTTTDIFDLTGTIADVCDAIETFIEAGGGVVDTCDTTLDGIAISITLTYHYDDPDAATYFLTAIGIDYLEIGSGGVLAGVEVECDGEPEPAEECSSCEELTLPACQDQYTITAGLTANTDYVVVITGQQGREYVQDVTSDNVGDITISTDNLPEGLTTPEQSPLQLVVRNDEGIDQTITNNNTTYPCVNLNFVYQESVTSIINLLIITDDYGNPIQDDLNNNIDIG